MLQAAPQLKLVLEKIQSYSEPQQILHSFTQTDKEPDPS